MGEWVDFILVYICVLIKKNIISTFFIQNTASATGNNTGALQIAGGASIGQDLYVTRDIIGNGDIDIFGSVSASVVSASIFIGDGSGITNVTASMRPDDFDFNSDPFAGTIGYIQGSGSLYKVATTANQIDFRYNDITIATITTAQGFSGSLFGIGDVVAFSGSVATRLYNLEISASLGPDAGAF